MRMFVAVLSLVAIGGCMGYQELSVYFDSGDLVVPSGQVVSVDAVTSGGDGPFKYDWEWSGPEGMGYGDGPAFRVTPGETFVGPKQYIIHVRVTDQRNHWATADKLVMVGSAAGHHDGSDNSNDNGNDNSDNGNDNDGGHHGDDNSNDNGGSHHHDNDNGDDHHQPPNPAVDLKVNGKDGPFEVAEGEQLQITWTSDDARRVDVSSNPPTSKFEGERATSTQVPELATFPPGTWTLKIVATGATGTTPASDTVVVVVVSQKLVITSVTVSPSCPFYIGQAVVFTVKTTGDGVLHFRLPTFTMNSDWQLDPSGTTTIPYIWPFKVWPNADGSPAQAFFWPDDRNSDPDRVKVPIIFR